MPCVLPIFSWFLYIMTFGGTVITEPEALILTTIQTLKRVIQDLSGLSKNQKKILEMLKIKPDMTTKEIAEMLFGKIVEYRSKEYTSVYRSLISLEKQGQIKRVQVHLRWQMVNQ